MSSGQADVLVEMESFNLRPVNVGCGRQRRQELELSCSGGGNNARFAARGQRTPNRGCRLLGGGSAQRNLVVEYSEKHRHPPGRGAANQSHPSRPIIQKPQTDAVRKREPPFHPVKTRISSRAKTPTWCMTLIPNLQGQSKGHRRAEGEPYSRAQADRYLARVLASCERADRNRRLDAQPRREPVQSSPCPGLDRRSRS